MRAVEANDPRTPSVQISDDLQDRIASGEFPPGAKLPSGRELVTQYGVALLTAQSALQRLREQRLAYSSGRGYFVGEPEAQPNLADQLAEVQAEVRELRERVETLEAGQ
jgi:GntR family transcriptional regulator